jgi:Flp pilus assembly protein TadD
MVVSNAADPNLIQSALAHHTAGRFAEAEELYRQILAAAPDNPSASHLLGVACSQQGRKDEAIEHISRAIALQPGAPDFHSNLALVYLEKMEPDKAMASAQRALALRPDHADALNHLGSAMKQMGRLQEAAAHYQRALSVRADHADALTNLADVYRRLGRLSDADALTDRLLKSQPDHFDALSVRGESLLSQRRFPEAANVFRAIIQKDPRSWVGHNGLGVALFRQGRTAEAIPLYAKSIELSPDNPGPYNNIGYADVVEGRLDEAIEYFNKAIALRRDFAEAYNNLGNAHLGKLELDRAMWAYEKALFFQPDNHDAHWNRSLLLLLRGDHANGWREYEWRWLKFPDQKRGFRQPLWDGFDIAGKTILLHAEQGFGDTIQFIRFAPRVAARGATVIVECQRELLPLLQGFPGVARMIGRGEALPSFDVHCPLMTLPYALGITQETIPAGVPYIAVDEHLRASWAEQLQGNEGRLKVGLAWAGAAMHGRDRDRSMPPDALVPPLAQLTGIRFVSLQRSEPGRANAPPAGLEMFDPTAQLRDFALTAALIANLDLVISVDTAVVHLAGAMGKPVWTLLPFSPDWRWLLDRDDSPWYPTMRLIRQRAHREWGGVIDRVVCELALLRANARSDR